MLASDPPPLTPGDTLPVPGLDGIYVLSVKSFADRIAHIRRELGAQRLDFEFVFDHDAEEFQRTLHSRHEWQSLSRCVGGIVPLLHHISDIVEKEPCDQRRNR